MSLLKLRSTMRLVGATTQRCELVIGQAPGPGIENLQDIGTRLSLPDRYSIETSVKMSISR